MPTYYDENPQDFYVPAKEWRPLYWTPMVSERTLGPEICNFIELTMNPPRENLSTRNRKFQILDWQENFLNHVFELDENGLLKKREAYLQVPRKNGKSFLASGVILYFLVNGFEGDEIAIGASSTRQARIIFEEVQRNIDNSILLQKLLDNKKFSIKNKYKNIVAETVAGDGNSSQGKAPFLAVGDELHVWDSVTGRSQKGSRLYASLKTGSMDRDESLFLGLTTAGEYFEGIAYQNFQKTKMIAEGSLEDPSFCGFVWAADEIDDISSEKTWKKANPNLQAGIMNLEEFKKQYEAASLTSTTAFERFHLNKWIQGGDKQPFIFSYYLEQQKKPELGHIPAGADIVLGFDGSLTEDSTGIIGIDINTRLIEVLFGWEKDPKNPNWFVNSEEVSDAIDFCFKNFNVKKMYADPSRHRELIQSKQRIYGKGIIRDIPPTHSRMLTMSNDFRTDFYEGKLFWNGDSRIRTHFLNAVENLRGLPNKESPNSARKIDFLACSILANGALKEVLDTSQSKKQGIKIF